MFIRLLVVIAILYGGYYVFYERNMVKISEANAPLVMKRMKTITPDEIFNNLAIARGGVGILYIYKSDCILCRVYTPDIIETYKKYNRKGVSFLIISLDDNEEKLAKYLSRQGADFTPYILPQGREQDLEGALKNLRIFYSGNLPFTVMVDNTGNPVTFTPSPSYQKRLEQKIDETLKRYAKQ